LTIANFQYYNVVAGLILALREFASEAKRASPLMSFGVSSKMYQLEPTHRKQKKYIIVYAFVISSHDGSVSYVYTADPRIRANSWVTEDSPYHNHVWTTIHPKTYPVPH